MKLVINIEGATDEEMSRGLAAAVKIFTDAGITPYDAQQGYAAMLAWDDAGFPKTGDFALTEQEARESDIWLEATEAAVTVAGAEWPEARRNQVHDPLSIVMTPEERAKFGV